MALPHVAVDSNPRETKSHFRRLRRRELPASTIELARFLVGKTIVRQIGRTRLAGRIVETEAYVTGDAACHAFRGRTPRNGSLFLKPGHAYVYFIYGSSFMLNVSSGVAGVGEGVLLRAAEPLEGLAVLQRNRGTDRVTDIARGPGRLAEAFEIDRSLDGVDLCAPGPLWLATSVREPRQVGESVRIGINVEADRVLRFYERGSPFVSGTRKLRE
jgi:DNA-3-methyladenine glycosylase